MWRSGVNLGCLPDLTLIFNIEAGYLNELELELDLICLAAWS